MAHTVKGKFGSAPTLEGVKLPKATSLTDDVKVASALGTLGGNIQYLLCSTAFYFGRMARDNGVTYNADGFYEAYYVALYGDGKGLQANSKTQQKLGITAYAEISGLPYETRDIAEYVFNQPAPMSLPQKGTMLRAIVKKYPKVAPKPEELTALLPKPKKEGASTILGRANGLASSIKDIRGDDDLMELINAQPKGKALFNAAANAIAEWAAWADTNKPERAPRAAKGAAPVVKPTAAHKAMIAAAAKALENATLPKGVKPS